VVYAPLRTRDLRIGNYLYLELASPVAEDQLVAVKIPDALLWQTTAPPATAPITNHQFPIANHGLAISKPFTATVAPSRCSPAIHVNQVGYVPALPKKAMIGYYLGSLGEMSVP